MPDEYIAQYGRRLYGLCIKLCGSPYEADDLYQETWLKAYCRFDRYDASLPFEHWLTAICVNCFRDMCRKNRFAELFAKFSTNEEQDRALQSVPSEEHHAEQAELWEAVRRLPEAYSTILILHYFGGYDVKELSVMLKKPEGTIKYRLYRARELLKGELTP